MQRDGAWSPQFEGQRPPFERGHELSVKHGAYSVVKLGPRVDELADALRVEVGALYRASDELAVRLLALCVARIEAAWAALEAAAPDQHTLLDTRTRGWVNTAGKLMNELGLTPAARARLGLDLVRTRETETLLELAERKRREGEIEAEATAVAEVES